MSDSDGATNDLRNALRTYTSFVLTTFVPNQVNRRRMEVGDYWQRQADGSFQLVENDQATTTLMSLSSVMGESAERALALEALRKHVLTRSHLDVNIGSHFTGSSRMTDERLLTGFVFEVFTGLAGAPYNDEVFDEQFRSMVVRLKSETVRVIFYAPLIGVSLAEYPVRLDKCLSLIEMPDEDVSACLTVNVIQPFFGRNTRTVPIAPVVAVRGVFEVEKIVNSSDSLPVAEVMKFAQNANDSVTEAIHALRAFRDGQFVAPVIVRASGWPNEGARSFQMMGGGGFQYLRRNTYNLGKDESAEFVAFLGRLREATSHTKTAARRLSFASERIRPDDRLLDLMIAAEAVFLEGVNAEIKFQFALRAAHYIDGSDYTRRQIFEFMRLAYKVRSALAHGDAPKPGDLKDPTGAPVSLADFARIVETLLRRALRKAVDVGETDWDGLIVPSG